MDYQEQNTILKSMINSSKELYTVLLITELKSNLYLTHFKNLPIHLDQYERTSNVTNADLLQIHVIELPLNNQIGKGKLKIITH